MTTQNPQVRRATVDDLAALAVLWQAEGLASPELEKRFKEFQVIDDGQGAILAAIGFQVVGLEGHLHSEAFARPEQADALRACFWERVQVIAQNHGVVRVWTQFATPFWNHSGLQYAAGDTLPKLPPAFGHSPHPWRFIQLRPDPPSVASSEKEFAMFKEMEHERTNRLLRQAKIMKLIAVIVVISVFVLVAFWILTWYKTQGRPR